MIDLSSDVKSSCKGWLYHPNCMSFKEFLDENNIITFRDLIGNQVLKYPYENAKGETIHCFPLWYSAICAIWAALEGHVDNGKFILENAK